MNIEIRDSSKLPQHQHDAMMRLLHALAAQHGQKALSIGAPYQTLRFVIGAFKHAGEFRPEQLEAMAEKGQHAMAEIMAMCSSLAGLQPEPIQAVADALDDFSQAVTDEERDPIANSTGADAAAVEAAGVLARARA